MSERVGEDIDEIEEAKAPLIEHLIELRMRLIRSFIALIVAFGVCYFFADEIYAFLTRPWIAALGDNAENRRMIATAPQEIFFTYLKISFWAATFVSFPFIANQIWKFIAPGLYKNEKQAFLPFLIASPVLFFLGGAMVYYVVMPLAMKFFLSFETAGGTGMLAIAIEPKVNEYLSLVMKLIFAFGLCFELPVVLSLMARVGLVSAEGLRKKRKYAIVIVFLVAAFLTPPDLISQIGLAIPVLLLYEISILSASMIEKKRAEREAEEEA